MSRYFQDSKGGWWYKTAEGNRKAFLCQCLHCSRPVPRTTQSKSYYCSAKCRYLRGSPPPPTRKGQECSSWKGGRIIHPSGYVLILKPDHPHARKSGYVLEHQLVMESLLGRHLTADEVVHHKNGLRDDNRLENLELWNKGHPKGQKIEDLVAWCKEILSLYPHLEVSEVEHGLRNRVHVNQHVIRRNKKTGERSPVLTVKTYKSNTYCHEVEILGPSKVIYSPDKPLSCGARVWIETTSEVICKGVSDGPPGVPDGDCRRGRGACGGQQADRDPGGEAED